VTVVTGTPAADAGKGPAAAPKAAAVPPTIEPAK
jgi:hypothetical protein